MTKQADKYINILTSAAEKKDFKVKQGIVINAIESLREKQDITKYFETYVGLVKKAMESKLDNKFQTPTSLAIKSGEITISEAAKKIALNRFAYILSHYTQEEYNPLNVAWKEAIPELYPEGKLRSYQ